MSGHSKWASIKHKKAATDARRGQLFTKLARAISVAAREGGGDPDSNFTLSAAIQKARDYSMPKDSIQRAIDRGTGAGADGETIERVLYEGYGPSGVAVLVEALTDNRNRTERRPSPHIRQEQREPRRAGLRGMGVREAGRGDGGRRPLHRGRPDPRDRRWGRGRRREGDSLKVVSAAEDLAAVRRALEAAGVDIESAQLTMEPKNVVEVGETDARAVMRLMEALDDHDDVEAVHANFDIPADVLEEIAA